MVISQTASSVECIQMLLLNRIGFNSKRWRIQKLPYHTANAFSERYGSNITTNYINETMDIIKRNDRIVAHYICGMELSQL